MNNTPGSCDALVTVPAPTAFADNCAPSATADNCGVATVINDYNGTASADDTYPVGTTTVTWTVTDVNGNTNTCTQDVTVVTDNEAPTITCSAAVTGKLLIREFVNAAVVQFLLLQVLLTTVEWLL